MSVHYITIVLLFPLVHNINTLKTYKIGQSGRDINTRYKEHIRYIRTNNQTSAYATHILHNNHEYGTAKDTLQI